MPTQQEIWRDEYENKGTFTRIHSDRPSGPIPGFAQLLLESNKNASEMTILDIGCGGGRNSVYLGSLGFRVVGIDFAPNAVLTAQARVNLAGLSNIEFQVADLGGRWPADSNSVSAVIDCNTSICVPNPGRANLIHEAERVLAPGGLYLFYGVARTEFADRSPGPEPDSALFPKSGKFEKQFTRGTLLTEFGRFELVSITSLPGQDVIEGELLKYSMWLAVFRKPE